MTLARIHAVLLHAVVVSQFTGGCVDDAVAPDDNAGDVTDGKADGVAGRCANLPTGPFQPALVGRPFDGSEDFTLDGRGGMVAKRGGDLVRVLRDGTVTSTIGRLPGQTLGLRFHPNGTLVGAMVNDGRIVSVAPNGNVADLVTGLNGPNGIYTDLAGTIWFTEGGANRVSRLDPGGRRTTIVSGTEAQGANGIVFDAATNRLFYTEYDEGKVHRVDLSADHPSPTLVATIPGGGLDGMALDACGNLYVVDQRRSKLFRIRLAPTGTASAAPELLADFPVNVANVQFGAGEGFDPNSLVVAGNPGSVFTLALGVPGAPVPTPAAPFDCSHTFTMPGTGLEQTPELRGDFRRDGWFAGAPLAFDPTDRVWRATIQIPAHTQIQYKFHYVQNGREIWITDPRNPETVAGNSVLRAVTCTPPL